MLEGVIPLIVVGSLIAVTVAIIVLWLAPAMPQRRVIFDLTPDMPTPFGCSMAWLALRTRDSHRVVTALGLDQPTDCNWSTGLGAVYDGKLGPTRVFVAPPVNGWTLVAGPSLPHPVTDTFTDKLTPELLRLSTEFGEAQYFVSYPGLDMYAWMRANSGKLQRAFAIGEAGVIVDKGRTPKEEKALGLKLFEVRGLKTKMGAAGGGMLLYPTERHVMRIAGQWSIDPTVIDKLAGQKPGLGRIGFAPASWRVELLRRRKTAA